MNEPDSVLAIWQARIATARATVAFMAGPQHAGSARGRLEAFFGHVEQLVEEAEDDDTLRTRLGTLLTGVANGLKGTPAPLHHHDWSDLPALAAATAAQLHAIKVLAGPLSCWFGDLLVNYAQTNDCLSMPSAQVVLGGVVANVSAGDLRALLAAISHVAKDRPASAAAAPDPVEALRLEAAAANRQPRKHR